MSPDNPMVEPWFDKAIRDHMEEHGPSGGAWNISMVLERLHRAAPKAASPDNPLPQPSIFDLLEPLAHRLLANGGPDIRGYYARGTGGVDIEPLIAALTASQLPEPQEQQ